MKSLQPQIRALNAYKAKVDALNEELIRKIEALPENPAITRIGENCFSISSKDLGTANWTPFYHDFTHQYKLLRALIENYDINQIERIFMEIMETGSYQLHKSLETTDGYEFEARSYVYHFHPDVIKMLKETM